MLENIESLKLLIQIIIALIAIGGVVIGIGKLISKINLAKESTDKLEKSIKEEYDKLEEKLDRNYNKLDTRIEFNKDEINDKVSKEIEKLEDKYMEKSLIDEKMNNLTNLISRFEHTIQTLSEKLGTLDTTLTKVITTVLQNSKR